MPNISISPLKKSLTQFKTIQQMICIFKILVLPSSWISWCYSHLIFQTDTPQVRLKVMHIECHVVPTKELSCLCHCKPICKSHKHKLCKIAILFFSVSQFSLNASSLFLYTLHLEYKHWYVTSNFTCGFVMFQMENFSPQWHSKNSQTTIDIYLTFTWPQNELK